MKNLKNVFFFGYCSQFKAYWLYNPINGKVIIGRNVVFDKDASWNWDDKETELENHILSLNSINLPSSNDCNKLHQEIYIFVRDLYILLVLNPQVLKK